MSFSIEDVTEYIAPTDAIPLKTLQYIYSRPETGKKLIIIRHNNAINLFDLLHVGACSISPSSKRD